MRALLVRHGESASNADTSVVALPSEQGDRLTERGLGQAHDAGRLLRDAGVTALISSPMRRARETAAAIGEEIGIGAAEIEIDEEIYELRESPGYTGLSMEEQQLRRWSARMTAHPDDPDHHEGGESFNDVRRRARALSARLRERDPEGLPLIVSHGIFIRFFLLDNLLGDVFGPGLAERLWYLRTVNCGVSLFEYDEGYHPGDPPRTDAWVCSMWMGRPS